MDAIQGMIQVLLTARSPIDRLVTGLDQGFIVIHPLRQLVLLPVQPLLPPPPAIQTSNPGHREAPGRKLSQLEKLMGFDDHKEINSIRLIHLTQNQPRRVGTTARKGKPCQCSSTSSPTWVASRICLASEIGKICA